MSESLEEQKLGDTRKGSKGPERYVPGRVGSFDLPFGLGGRWVSQDEYTRITGKPAPTPSTSSAPSEPAKGGMNAAELKAAQDAANKARQQGRLSDLRGGSVKVEPPKREEPKVEQPKVEQPKPKLSLDQQYKAARAAKDTAAMEKLGKQIWAKKYSTPEGESKFKAKGVDVSTAKQREMFKDIRAPKPTLKPFERAERIKPKMEAYEVVLDYLLSEGHAETVEEAHYVMMQLDSEYVQSIVEAGLPIPPGGIKPDRLNPIDPATGKSMYKVVPGASGKPKEIRNPSFGKLPPA
jgi:hypothetical protein